MTNQPKWPKPGDKLIFKGVPKIYFPHFIPMGKYARENLIIDKEYALTDIQINSSWVSVFIEGHSEMLNLTFFKY